MNASLADRAAQIASRARAVEPAEKPRELTAKELRGLEEAWKASHPKGTWYRLTRPGCGTIDVAFNPAVTLEDARAWYPGCDVQQA